MSEDKDMPEEEEDFDADFEDEVGEDGEGEDEIDEFGFDDDFQSETSLKEAFENNPALKIVVAVVALIIIGGAVVLFGGEKKKPANSIMAAGDSVSQPPGTEPVSPAYEQAVIEYNTQTVEDARRTGGSALPVPITPPVGRVSIENERPQEIEDPLKRWRRIQEERAQEAALAPPPEPPPVVAPEPVQDPHLETINALAEAMAAQMQSVLELQTIDPMQQVSVASADFIEQQRQAELARLAEQAAFQQQTDAAAEGQIVDIIIPAGTIEYAQLLTEANSEAQGPILAQILTGPLSGSRMLGSFGVQERFLTLNFDTIVVDGVGQSINAIALDPDEVRPGVISDIDHRYFRRIVLPMAASFIEGVGSGIADTGNTTVSVEGETVVESEEDLDLREEIFQGVEEAASTLSDIIDEAGDVEPILRVEVGTPMGILFTQPVTEQNF